MAFTNPGKIVRLRSRPNGRGSVYEANMWAQQHSDGLFSGRGVIRHRCRHECVSRRNN